jgi:hypothetical protein
MALSRIIEIRLKPSGNNHESSIPFTRSIDFSPFSGISAHSYFQHGHYLTTGMGHARFFSVLDRLKTCNFPNG